MKSAASSPQFRDKPRRQRLCGGTLLEVLISLVIVSMISTSLLQAGRNSRLAREQATREAQGMQAAIHWRQARGTGQLWAVGDAGTIPESPIQWTLQSLPANTNNQPDASWRLLTLSDAHGALLSTPLRLDPAPSPPAEGAVP